jgi:hypothetical protein
MFAGPAERIEHPLNTVVIAINEGIIKNDRSGIPPFSEHGTHGKANKNGNLLLRTIGDPLERLGPLAFDTRDGKAISKLKLRAREEVVKEGTQVPPYRCIVVLATFGKASQDRVAKQPEHRDALLNPRAVALGKNTLLVRGRKSFADSVAARCLNLTGDAADIPLKLP